MNKLFTLFEIAVLVGFAAAIGAIAALGFQYGLDQHIFTR
jgi:hypothetical protein